MQEMHDGNASKSVLVSVSSPALGILLLFKFPFGPWFHEFIKDNATNKPVAKGGGEEE